MRSQNSLHWRVISLIIALIFVVFLSADNAFARVSVSCQEGPPTWKWTVHLKAGDVLKRGDLFILVFGGPVKKDNLTTPSNWTVKSAKGNRVRWQYTGRTINVRRDGPIAEFGYEDSTVVDGVIPWRASFPRNTDGNTCGPVSLTSPRGGHLVAPSVDTRAIEVSIPSEDGKLQSADGTVTISFPANSESETEEITYMPQLETVVDNFTVVRSFTLDTYEEDDQPKTPNSNQPVTVQATYTDVELNNANEEELKLYYFDSGRNEWVSVRSTVDIAANKVVAELNDPDSFNKLYTLMAPAMLEASAPSQAVAPPEASVPSTEVSESSPSNHLNSLVQVTLIVLAGWLGLRKLRQRKASSNKN